MSAEKTRLHPRNRNRNRYDLEALRVVCPDLEAHIQANKRGEDSINFADPKAVKLLNQALLAHYYGIKNWDFPAQNLCPPIPGRADYIHYVADLLAQTNDSNIPKGDKITCLDVGIGATCIYPILGVVEYDWRFVGTDVNADSLKATRAIVKANPILKDKIVCRTQANSKAIFAGVVGKEERFELSICNPPFHASLEEAQKGSRRKIKNLSGKKMKTPKLNFGGTGNELVFEGGEAQFIQTMIEESKQFAEQFYWFSCLVSTASKLKRIYKILQKAEAKEVQTITMGTGNKTSRIVAWTFLSKEAQKIWREERW